MMDDAANPGELEEQPQNAEEIARSIRLDMQVANIHPHNRAWINERVDRLVELAKRPRDLSSDHIKAVCQPGTASCCRFLAAGAGGFMCAKLTSLAGYINRRADAGEMRATADNCAGMTGSAMLS